MVLTCNTRHFLWLALSDDQRTHSQEGRGGEDGALSPLRPPECASACRRTAAVACRGDHAVGNVENGALPSPRRALTFPMTAWRNVRQPAKMSSDSSPIGFKLGATMRHFFALVALASLISGAAAEDSFLSVAVVGLDGQQHTLTAVELDALPRVAISAREHGAQHVFEGALLGDVLAKVGAPAGKAIRGPELADVVIVEARDGYKVALDLAGTDASMRTSRVILADRMDGSPLDANRGPIQLVVEGDLRAARAVTMVSAIRLQRVR